jgi:hypothetical protein
MTTEPHVDLDRQLRDAYAPEPEAVDRVAARALGEALPRRARRWAITGSALAAALVLAVAAAIRLFGPSGTEPPGTESAATLEPVDPASEAVVSALFTDGVLVVPVSDTEIVIFDAGEREERPPDGFGIVLVEGELR